MIFYASSLKKKHTPFFRPRQCEDRYTLNMYARTYYIKKGEPRENNFFA